MNKEQLKNFLSSRGFNPRWWKFIDDYDCDAIQDIESKDFVLALIDDAYSMGDGEHRLYFEVVKDLTYEYSPAEGWTGPIRYIVAFVDLGNEGEI